MKTVSNKVVFIHWSNYPCKNDWWGRCLLSLIITVSAIITGIFRNFSLSGGGEFFSLKTGIPRGHARYGVSPKKRRRTHKTEILRRRSHEKKTLAVSFLSVISFLLSTRFIVAAAIVLGANSETVVVAPNQQRFHSVDVVCQRLSVLSVTLHNGVARLPI